VDCVIRKNGDDGLYVGEGNVMLRGGTITENKSHGVSARGGKVTAAKAEEGKSQTVSKDYGIRFAGTGIRFGHCNWSSPYTGGIIGIPQEQINVGR